MKKVINFLELPVSAHITWQTDLLCRIQKYIDDLYSNLYLNIFDQVKFFCNIYIILTPNELPLGDVTPGKAGHKRLAILTGTNFIPNLILGYNYGHSTLFGTCVYYGINSLNSLSWEFMRNLLAGKAPGRLQVLHFVNINTFIN